ncbi:MAG: efflux RND transporter periplasmic adaptor subunit [Gemmatimonadota bacterium]
MMKSRRWAVLLATLWMPGCGTQVEADEDAVDAVVAAAALSSVDAEAGYVGPLEGAPSPEMGPPEDATGSLYTVLYSERDAEIRARRDGHVRNVGAEIGDRVGTGQRLALLESDEEEAAVASAKAAVEYARLQEERTRALAEDDLTTRAELEAATYGLRAAEAALQDAIAKLQRTRVRAPFGGVVTRRFVRLGSYVEEGDPLFRVTVLRPLRALVRVPEAVAVSIEPGLALVLEAVDGTRVGGSVARVAPAVDPASGTVDVLLDVPDPGTLRPGSSVRVLPTPR